ncbi:MAG TPA: PadR family transcriptional regulator [Acidimicrobiales bacterium]|nr:PadR family transcriptional regulator [Acidimicrobiales bacterium]
MHNHEHPPWAAPPPFGGRRGRRRNMGFGPPGAFFGPGPRARGDVRAAILALLAEAPMHGYQIITEITDRSQGVWSPSPGSVYPTLQALEEEGLVTSATADGKKVFSLTEAGRAADQGRPGGRAPWEEVGDDVDAGLLQLRDGIAQVAGAVRQIARGGTTQQVAKARSVLAEARKSLYRILADDDEA